MVTNHSLEALNDQTLLSQFGVLVRQDHEGNANLLRHIDAIDRRQIWAKLGYPSMFAPRAHFRADSSFDIPTNARAASVARSRTTVTRALQTPSDPLREWSQQAQTTPGSARPPKPERRPRRDRRARARCAP